MELTTRGTPQFHYNGLKCGQVWKEKEEVYLEKQNKSEHKIKKKRLSKYVMFT